MVPSPRGQKTRTLTHRTLATLGLLGLLSAGVVVGHSGDALANGTCDLTGDGVDGNPYLVTSAADLAKVGVGDCGLDAHYKQTAGFEIDAPSEGQSNHTPIGADFPRFTGVYDGGNNTITGLTVVSTDGQQGMFGATGSATVKDLSLASVSISTDGGDVGAVVGKSVGASISNVHVLSGTVQGDDDVGGLIGEVDGGTYTDLSSAADVTGGSYYAGGLIGFRFDGVVSQSSASGSVTGGENAAGGLIGGSQGGTTQKSYAVGDVAIVDGSTNCCGAQAGGFVGWFFSGTISSSYSTGDVSVGVGGDEVGGFVGFINFSDNGDFVGTISDSYSTGNVLAADSDKVGGFVGLNKGNITNSYSTGNVTGSNQVGGFVGLNDTDATTKIDTSYSLGSADGTDGASHVGGFAGEKENTSTITNSFWDTVTSGLEERDGVDDGATGKTTEEMTSIATFNDTATEGLTTSWAIVAASAFEQPTGPTNQIWGIGAGANCGYPFLYWQTETAITCDDGSGGTDSSETDGSTSASGSSPEKQASSPAIHLDLQATVGQQVEGAPVVIGGQGLAPGSTMTLVVRSTPQTLATGTMSALGNWSTKINLPALPSGSHTLTLTGTAPDGSIVTLTQGFTISTTGTFTALDTVASGQTVGLAATGPAAHLMWSGIAGLGLLLAGLALTAAKNGLRGRQSL